jgi:ribosomal protein S18 acetylase RimI-like enzyme
VFRARPFESERDLRLMQELVARSWEVEKPLVGVHVGDLAWRRYQHVGREHEWRIRLWEAGDEGLAAWAWLFLPDELDFHVRRRDRAALIPEILDWLAAEAPGRELRVGAFDREALTVDALIEAGFRPTERDAFASMALDLRGGLPEPVLPPGFRARHVAGVEDLGRRAAVHQAAFSPSRVTEESYANVMDAWPYRPELDWVAEAPDGRFAAFCLVWLDERNRVGELEPVGTHPAFRRRGLARAVCASALLALREAGADTAVVYAAEGAPATGLYRGLGFQPLGIHVTLTRERP